MKLIVITGIDHAPKRTAVALLADHFVLRGARVQIIDNADQALRLSVPRWRLPGECGCCTLAFGLIEMVNRLEGDYALISVSGSAAPDALALMLDSLRAPNRTITTLALVSSALWVRAPYLAANLTAHTDYCIENVSEIAEVFDALI